jgi:hypothetical protein
LFHSNFISPEKNIVLPAFREIPLDEYTDLRILAYTYSAIEQVNADDRSTRTQLASMIGAIVSGKRGAEELDEVDDMALWKRIQKDNARLQSMSESDLRELRRVQWMVHETQKKHFLNWEKFCVDFGFAREAESEEERSLLGQIVFHDPSRIIQADEYAFALNGQDEKSGGRPPMVPSAEDLKHNPGQSSNKTSEKCSILQAINFGNEALPPFIIFPTKAKQENVQINPHTLRSFHQIKGQYGLDKAIWWDSCIAKTYSGGMQGYIWNKWITEYLMYYYPDAQDVPGKRVLIKADSGPGESSVDETVWLLLLTNFLSLLLLIAGRNFGEVARDFLVMLRVCGFYFYPGLPNGTELGQEMDQLFSKLKGLLYGNRDKLWKARLKEGRENAVLTLNDIGYILFGGEIQLESGQQITLEKAFEQGLTPDLIQGAREKCGYCPATRAALNSERLRHEVVEDVSGNIDNDADPYGSLLNQLEIDNHKVCEKLIEKGYPAASVHNMRLTVRRVTANQIQGREATMTQQGTRARQDALMQVHTAGQYYHVTNGGWVMNCTDMMFVHERKLMTAQYQKMIKEKDVHSEFAKIKDAYDVFVASPAFRSDCARWKVPELKVILR